MQEPIPGLPPAESGHPRPAAGLARFTEGAWPGTISNIGPRQAPGIHLRRGGPLERNGQCDDGSGTTEIRYVSVDLAQSRLMNDDLVSVRRFATSEERDRAFRERTHIVIPNLLAGRHTFFEDLHHWVTGYGAATDSSFLAVVPPDPTTGLCYPYPLEELAAVLALVPRLNGKDEAAWLAEYDLGRAILGRPTIALSGGERLILSFVKAEILAPVATGLLLCSPTQWLFPANYTLLSRVVDAYRAYQKQIEVLILNGEVLPFENDVTQAPYSGVGVQGLEWELELVAPCVVFPERRFPYESPAKHITFVPNDTPLSLQSPTLCKGPNGVGKSTLAKVLCGCCPLESGFVSARVGGFKGGARLVMQTYAGQLFGSSPLELLDAVFRYDTQRFKVARAIFDELQGALAEEVDRNPSMGVIGGREPDSALQAKVALTAARLASDVPLLVLDEPMHGLSLDFGRIFVRSVATIAHRRQIAVVVIAHVEEALRGLMKSTLSLQWLDGERSKVKVTTS